MGCEFSAPTNTTDEVPVIVYSSGARQRQQKKQADRSRNIPDVYMMDDQPDQNVEGEGLFEDADFPVTFAEVHSKKTQDVYMSNKPNQNIDGKGLFEDPDFPAIVDTITKDTKNENYQTFKGALWRRPIEIMRCGYDEIKVFDTIDVNDIKQGFLGNCYFLAALAGLAEVPERVEAIFKTRTANKEGKYAVKFYLRGVPTVVTIDDRFPCYNYSPYDPLFSKPQGKELWAILLEKAWAKLFKGYINTESGQFGEALEYLTGAPSFFFPNDQDSDDEVWARLKQADLKNYIIGASSRGGVQEARGIISGHAYTVISVYEVQGLKLLKMRNPWGRGEWDGDFSDSSGLWTESLKKVVGFEKADDGIFFMTLKDFRNYYRSYTIHHYQDSWQYSCLEQKSGPKHANYYKFSVDKPCEVFFRIHQEDARSLSISKEDRNSFKYSPASFMIVKVEKNGQYKLVLDSDVATDPNLVFGRRTLYMTKDGKVEIQEAGDYIIRAKVLWRYGKEDTCTISAYSSAKIDLKPIPSVKDFQTKYLTLLANKNKEEKPLTSQSLYAFAWAEGRMYIMVKNREKKQLTCSIDFTKLENVKLSKPNKVSENKFMMNIAPGSSQLVFLKKTDRSQKSAPAWSWDYKLEELSGEI